MPTPGNSVPNPPRGQLFNVTDYLPAATTGNPVSGGLTALGAKVSKDDGSFANCANAPVELLDTDGATKTGVWSLDLTATEMDAAKVVVMVFSSTTGAVTKVLVIRTADLRVNTQRYDLNAVMRIERLFLDVHDFLYNHQVDDGALQQVFNRDGFLKASGAIVEGDVQGTRSKLV